MSSASEMDLLKERVGSYALKFVDGCKLIGLGHGSTTDHFTRALGRLPDAASRFQCACVSRATHRVALEAGLTVIPDDKVELLDIYVDGADEITPQKTMIKGGGGALLRERIGASLAKFRVILVDYTKVHVQLGQFPIPIEISNYGYDHVVTNVNKTLEELGHKIEFGRLRLDKNERLFYTDNGYPIYDVK